MRMMKRKMVLAILGLMCLIAAATMVVADDVFHPTPIPTTAELIQLCADYTVFDQKGQLIEIRPMQIFGYEATELNQHGCQKRKPGENDLIVPRHHLHCLRLMVGPSTTSVVIGPDQKGKSLICRLKAQATYPSRPADVVDSCPWSSGNVFASKRVPLTQVFQLFEGSLDPDHVKKMTEWKKWQSDCKKQQQSGLLSTSGLPLECDHVWSNTIDLEGETIANTAFKQFVGVQESIACGYPNALHIKVSISLSGTLDKNDQENLVSSSLRYWEREKSRHAHLHPHSAVEPKFVRNPLHLVFNMVNTLTDDSMFIQNGTKVTPTERFRSQLGEAPKTKEHIDHLFSEYTASAIPSVKGLVDFIPNLSDWPLTTEDLEVHGIDVTLTAANRTFNQMMEAYISITRAIPVPEPDHRQQGGDYIVGQLYSLYLLGSDLLRSVPSVLDLLSKQMCTQAANRCIRASAAPAACDTSTSTFDLESSGGTCISDPIFLSPTDQISFCFDQYKKSQQAFGDAINEHCIDGEKIIRSALISVGVERLVQERAASFKEEDPLSVTLVTSWLGREITVYKPRKHIYEFRPLVQPEVDIHNCSIKMDLIECTGCTPNKRYQVGMKVLLYNDALRTELATQLIEQEKLETKQTNITAQHLTPLFYDLVELVQDPDRPLTRCQLLRTQVPLSRGSRFFRLGFGCAKKDDRTSFIDEDLPLLRLTVLATANSQSCVESAEVISTLESHFKTELDRRLSKSPRSPTNPALFAITLHEYNQLPSQLSHVVKTQYNSNQHVHLKDSEFIRVDTGLAQILTTYFQTDRVGRDAFIKAKSENRVKDYHLFDVEKTELRITDLNHVNEGRMSQANFTKKYNQDTSASAIEAGLIFDSLGITSSDSEQSSHTASDTQKGDLFESNLEKLGISGTWTGEGQTRQFKLTGITMKTFDQNTLDANIGHMVRHVTERQVKVQHIFPIDSSDLRLKECREEQSHLCPTGFGPGPYRWNGCTKDIDECAPGGGHQCTDGRTCVNHQGGYSCSACDAERAEDGPYKCKENPCKINNGECSFQRHCTSVKSKRICGLCPFGFYADTDTTCATSNPCLANSTKPHGCAKNEICEWNDKTASHSCVACSKPDFIATNHHSECVHPRGICDIRVTSSKGNPNGDWIEIGGSFYDYYKKLHRHLPIEVEYCADPRRQITSLGVYKSSYYTCQTAFGSDYIEAANLGGCKGYQYRICVRHGGKPLNSPEFKSADLPLVYLEMNHEEEADLAGSFPKERDRLTWYSAELVGPGNRDFNDACGSGSQYPWLMFARPK